MAPPSTRNIFISYNQADKEWLERLKSHLKPFVREGRLDYWDDTHIHVGADWQQEMQTALDRAQAAVLLISADSFASDFINETELPPLLTRAQENGVRILPVILSASRFAHHPSMARFQAANSPDRPLDTMPADEQEEVLQRIAERITEWRLPDPVTEEALDGSAKATAPVCFDEDDSLLRLQAILANCQKRLYTRFVDLSSQTMRLTTSLGSHALHPDKLAPPLRFLAHELGLHITVAGGGAGCTTIILNISAPNDEYIDPDALLDDKRFHELLESAGIEFVSYATLDRFEAIYRHRIGTFIYGTDRAPITSGGAVQYGTQYSPSVTFGVFDVTMPGSSAAASRTIPVSYV